MGADDTARPWPTFQQFPREWMRMAHGAWRWSWSDLGSNPGLAFVCVTLGLPCNLTCIHLSAKTDCQCRPTSGLRCARLAAQGPLLPPALQEASDLRMGAWEYGMSWDWACLPILVWWEGVGANRFAQDKVCGAHLALITTAVQWVPAVLGARLEPSAGT